MISYNKNNRKRQSSFYFGVSCAGGSIADDKILLSFTIIRGNGAGVESCEPVFSSVILMVKSSWTRLGICNKGRYIHYDKTEIIGEGCAI